MQQSLSTRVAGATLPRPGVLRSRGSPSEASARGLPRSRLAALPAPRMRFHSEIRKLPVPEIGETGRFPNPKAGQPGGSPGFSSRLLPRSWPHPSVARSPVIGENAKASDENAKARKSESAEGMRNENDVRHGARTGKPGVAPARGRTSSGEFDPALSPVSVGFRSFALSRSPAEQ
jgi:hypothetical protein